MRCEPSSLRDSSSARPRVATPPGSGSRQALAATLCGLALIVGCVRRDETADLTGGGSASAPSVVVATTPPAVEVPTPGGPSTRHSLAVLPAAALTALQESRPTFTLLEPRTSPNSIASAYESGDVILRADLQGLGRIDYAVTGLDQGVFRVIALFAAADGTFRAVDVATATPDPKRIPGVPAVLLDRSSCVRCMKGSTAAVIVVRFVREGGASFVADRWVWRTESSTFEIDEPDD